MAIYKLEDILEKTGASVSDITSVSNKVESDNNAGVWEKISNSVKKAGSNIAESFQGRVEGLVDRGMSGQGAGSTVLQTLGATAGVAGDIVGEGINLATFGKIPQIIEAGSKLVPDFIANAGADAVIAYEDWKSANPEQAANLEATTNIVLTAPVGSIAKTGAQGVKTAAGAVTRGVGAATGAVADVARPVLETAGSAAKTIGNATKTIGNAAAMAAEGATRIPGRLATNVAEQAATKAAIKELPTKIAQRAVQDGIDIIDTKQLYEIPTAQKPMVKKLVTSVQDFAAGKTKVNPIEEVGKPIVEKIKVLNSQKGKIGKQLGEVADNLGDVTKPELETAVFNSMTKVPGLQGLKMAEDGLDFADTSLASSLSAADQSVINEAFMNATKGGTGKAAHLYRQELFEILGGKKKSLANITDTQERALEAIRKGLSDVLEIKNPQYKKLSSQYRAVVQPLNDLNKLLKSQGLDQDLLNMSAALLARRLTSNAASNPQIRQILRSMDKVTLKGKTLPKVEMLQDVYNILDKYYNIEGGTTLQGQVGRAVSKSLNAKDLVTSAITENIGVTPAVQRKALEDMLKEIFK